MKEMTIEATVENIPVVTDFVNEELEALDCSMKVQMQIDVAIDELFGNMALPRSGSRWKRSPWLCSSHSLITASPTIPFPRKTLMLPFPRKIGRLADWASSW